jgi:hypothetical protein
MRGAAARRSEGEYATRHCEATLTAFSALVNSSAFTGNLNCAAKGVGCERRAGE